MRASSASTERLRSSRKTARGETNSSGELSSTVLLGIPAIHPARLAGLGNLVAAIVGFSFEDARVHGGLAVLAFLAVVAVGVVLLAQPGALG